MGTKKNIINRIYKELDLKEILEDSFYEEQSKDKIFKNNMDSLYSKKETIEKIKQTKNKRIKLLLLNILITSSSICGLKYLIDSYLDYRLVPLYSYNHINLKNNKEINIQEIRNIIINNPNLTIDEKKITLQLIPIIEENKEYIYNDILIHQLTNLDIKYSANENDKLIQENTNIVGMYTPPYHTNPIISLYSDEEFKTINCDDCNNGVLFHELNHTLTNYVVTKNQENYSYSKAISLLGELTNEIYTREYGDSFLKTQSNGYNDYMPLMYMLCELIEIDNIKAYRFDLKPEHIIKELISLDNNSSNAYEFMENINKCDIYKKEIINSKTNIEFINSINEAKEHFETLYNQYKYYYELKYNHKLIENKNVMYSIFSTPFETTEVKEVIEKELYNKYQITNIIITDKTYFDYYEFTNHNQISKDGTFINYIENIDIKIQQKGYFSSEYIEKSSNTILNIDEKFMLSSNYNVDELSIGKNVKKLNKLF